jgi:hypothetical protein
MGRLSEKFTERMRSAGLDVDRPDDNSVPKLKKAFWKFPE